jgi:uncharacterized protein YwgA
VKQEIVLKACYNYIFEEDFDYCDFDKRLNLQKSLYLLQNMGLNVGGYGFYWYKHGPYSQALQEDAYKTLDLEVPKGLKFTDAAQKLTKKLKYYIEEKPDGYTISEWLEAIASVHYLLDEYSDDEVLDVLEDRKPHLINRKSNKKALKIAKEIS